MPLWTYRASIGRVVDGDTVQDVVIDAGFCLHFQPPYGLRLLGINTPELHDPDPAVKQRAAEARAYVATWLFEHASHLGEGTSTVFPFLVQTEKTDHFARWLAHVTCGQGHSLEADLLAAGLADPYLP